MSKTPPFILILPDECNTLPLVIDSPHSGSLFPDDFKTDVQEDFLLTAWDAFVDSLWKESVSEGATLLSATFPRVYIDPNRAPDDIDPYLLDVAWPRASRPTQYSERGMGLIRRYALPGMPLYTAPLSVRDVEHRLEEYYMPYHQALKERLDALHAKFDGVWHIDCHSMKSVGNAMNIDNELMRPDVILGDLDGTSAAASFTDLIENSFNNLGYSTARNRPYKGGYLVSNYSNLDQNRHSIQVELNRALYMNEQTFEPNEHFDKVKKDIAVIVSHIGNYIKRMIE